MNKKIFVFDIGNTLFDKKIEKQVSNDILNCLVCLQNNGYKVGVCTFRSYNECKYLLPINLDFYICYNGSQIIINNRKVYDNKILFPKLYKNYMLANDKGFYTTSIETLDFAKAHNYDVKLEIIEEKSNLIMFFNAASIDKLNIDNFNYSYWKNDNLLLLQDKADSKLHGLDKLINYYDSNEDNIFYFGDGINDLDIFKKYIHSITFNDSYHELIKCAYHIIDKSKGESIVSYINKTFVKL